MDELCRYICHADAPRYRRAGWRVFPLDCHHGYWAMLAVKRVRARA